MARSVLTVLLVIGVCNSAQAEAVVGKDVVEAEFIDPFIDELNDDGGRLDIQDVTHEPLASQFHRQGSSVVAHLSRSRWYRFTLDPILRRDGPFVLATGRHVESATLFEPTPLGYRAERFGAETPVAERRLRNGMTNVDLPESDYGMPLYVRIVGPAVAGLYIEAQETMAQEAASADLRWIFFGAIYGVLALAAFIFAIVTRVPAFSYYGIYMAAQAMDRFGGLPFARRALWPVFATPEVLIDTIYVTVASLSSNWFLRFALGTRTSPVFDRILVFNGWGGAVTGVACVLLDHFYGTTYGASVLAFFGASTLGMTAVIAFIRWRQRYVSAGIYLLGIAGVAVGFASYPFFRGLTADLGFVWEATTFLAALAHRLVVLTKDREAALAETLAAKDAVAREFALRVQTTEGFNQAFARFVPRAFLEVLGRLDVREVRLGDHVEREMNVLFCDIRSFVALSETLKPEATFRFLNQYFGRVGPIVRANNGFVDQYLGDGFKALFPGSSDDALRAAIVVHAEIRRFNEVRAREGLQPIQIGVALHRGPVILATIGESERYDTTVVTEVVNVAARLEGLTKVYGARIIASESVVSNLLEPQSYNLRSLGELQILGSAKPIVAYEVCDGDPADVLLHKRTTSESFAAGIAAYRRGDFPAAATLFSDLVAREPQDSVARFFAGRSRRRGEMGTLAWDGVERHETKS